MFKLYNREIESQDQYIQIITEKALELAIRDREDRAIEKIMGSTGDVLNKLIPTMIAQRKFALSKIPSESKDKDD